MNTKQTDYNIEVYSNNDCNSRKFKCYRKITSRSVVHAHIVFWYSVELVGTLITSFTCNIQFLWTKSGKDGKLKLVTPNVFIKLTNTIMKLVATMLKLKSVLPRWSFMPSDSFSKKI